MPALRTDLASLLDAADAAMMDSAPLVPSGRIGAGVDLGTAYVVVFVVSEDGTPIAGTYRAASVVRDGVVLDFAGATSLLRELKDDLEIRIGQPLQTAATTYPPGVAPTEVRAARYVLEAAGLECTALVDEPTAANAVLEVHDGAVIDVGGGTTGVAIVQGGHVVYTADEPTGGTHLTLVVAGSHGISIAAAEELKTDLTQQRQLFPVVRPVLERIGTIVAHHVRDHDVRHLYLVGGTSAFPGIAEVVSEVTGIEASVPGNPLFVTPLGVALHDRVPADAGRAAP
jgi:ethanolamine utilization protein EutJ